MIYFILSQIGIIAYAFCIALKESEFILERRDYAPLNSPYDDPFHFFGATAACVVGVMAVLFQQSLEAYILTPLLCFFWYKTVYNITLGVKVFPKWYYLGNTSEMDDWYKNKFGVFAGIWAACIAGFVIVVLNLIYFL